MPIVLQGRAPRRGPLARALVPATLLCASVAAALAAGVALAGPAAAMEDPRSPTVEVTHGPSCGPAVVRVQVTGGDAGGHVALVFDGTAVQQEADLGPGQQVELGSADVGWGVTVDVSVTAAAADGAVYEPVQLGTYTRPSQEDCAAIAAPVTVPVTVPVAAPVAVPFPAHVRPVPAAASRGTVAAGGAPTRPVTLMAGAALLVAAGGLGASAIRRPRDDDQPADLGR